MPAHILQHIRIVACTVPATCPGRTGRVALSLMLVHRSLPTQGWHADCSSTHMQGQQQQPAVEDHASSAQADNVYECSR
jgi:hypothetical protein